jgi:hypothetical protein
MVDAFTGVIKNEGPLAFYKVSSGSLLSPDSSLADPKVL